MKPMNAETAKELEDRITHLLSEWLNDDAPLGENRYREPAKAAIKEVLAFISVIRRVRDK